MRYLFATLLLTLSAYSFAAPLSLNVNLMMDGVPLDWDTTYTNEAGQDFTIDMLKFYVSNVALVNNDGSETELEGLELASFESGDETSGTFMSVDAPAGTYSGIRFDIGVPRELNHLDATLQDAPLGVDSGMYWAWNPGYIFYRLEGRAEVDGADQPWLLHMGTDAFRLPVRIQDLLTGTVTIDVPAEGAEVSFDLDLMQAFSQGLNGGDYDFANDAYRAVHGGPISAQAYTNLLNAITLSGDATTDATATEEVQAAGEPAEVETMQGEDIADEVGEPVEADEATMDHSTMQDADTEGADAEMDHSTMSDTEAETTATDASSAIIGGDISGTVSLSDGIAWDSVIVLACTRADAADRRCETPIIISPEVEDPEGSEASFTFSDVPAGEYMIYTLNDTDGNEAHTMQGAEAEAMGVWLEPGSFDALFVSPPTTGISLELSSAE